MKSHCHKPATLLILLIIIVQVIDCTATLRPTDDEVAEESNITIGTRWAVLVAGSNGYENYRHQADVCHAYQILKKGGLKDENIIVFMYDDIAHNEYNPTPGKIINKPQGNDVYAGVPKDYTGNATTSSNLYAVLLGNKTALSGGSGKVVKSGPNDQIFLYYADHGSPGVIGMPDGDIVYAKDLNQVLKTKHASGSYKKMVIYIEACEAGSLFKGLLSDNMNIYATTASNPVENSYGTYCPGGDGKSGLKGSPDYYGTCLGDLYSVSWLEDSDEHDLRKETLKQQYDTVKKRTAYSHVMQYGNLNISKDFLFTFMGSNPKTAFSPSPSPNLNFVFSKPWRIVSQHDATLLYLQHKVKKSPEGSNEKIRAQKRLEAEISHREQVDRNMDSIVKLLFGDNRDAEDLVRRPSWKPLVDDWDCFKTLVKTYEEKCGCPKNVVCGRRSTYARKYTGVIAGLCNAGVDEKRLSSVISQACA